jgi:hypothetical protein
MQLISYSGLVSFKSSPGAPEPMMYALELKGILYGVKHLKIEKLKIIKTDI